MQHNSEPHDVWRTELARRFGTAVLAIRNERGLTTTKLADKTQDLGFPIHRYAITKIENNARAGKLDLAELIILSLALGVSPMQLLFPELPDGQSRLWPAAWDLHSNVEILLWFSGELPVQDLPGTLYLPPADTRRVELSREIQQLRAEIRHLYKMSMSTATSKGGFTEQEKQRQIDYATEELESRITEALQRGWHVNDN